MDKKDHKLATVCTVIAWVVTTGIGIGGIFIGWWGLREAAEQKRIGAEGLELNRNVYDRQTGRTNAAIKVIGITPNWEEYPKDERIDSLSDKSERYVRFSWPQSLVWRDPQLVIENAGTDVVEAIRVEYRLVGALKRGNGEDFWIRDGFLTNSERVYRVPFKREDVQLSKGVAPGSRVRIPLINVLNTEILNYQQNDHYDLLGGDL